MRHVIPIAAALLATACTTADPPVGGQTGHVDEAGELSSSQQVDTTDGAGQVTVAIDVEDARSFLVTVQSGDNTALTSLVGPGGETVVDGAHWYEQPYWYAEAITGGAVDATFNWPVRAQDGPLETGTYLATFEVYDDELEYLTDHPVDVTIHQNHDDDVTRGYLRVLVVWADGVDDDPEAVDGTQRAVARWAEIWEQAGIAFDVEYVTSDIDPDLDSPGEGEALAEAGALGDGSQMIVVVGELVAGGGTLGEAGGIPGPLIATNHTGMVLGWLDSAGTDGQFSDADVEVFAETMAHEMGHYLGLFHAFEQADDEDVVSAWDALDDTPTCGDSLECEALFASNVMVPYTVYGGDDQPIVADILTPMQSAQMQHYTGVVGGSAAGSEPGSTPAPEANPDSQGPSGAAEDAADSLSFAEVLQRAPAATRAELVRLRRHLASREAAVACPGDVSADSYRRIIESVAAPSYVPMRAARCLVEQAGDDAASDMRVWLTDEASAGLARLARRRLHRLSPSEAAALEALTKR